VRLINELLLRALLAAGAVSLLKASLALVMQ
jgi:hypothetical protein